MPTKVAVTYVPWAAALADPCLLASLFDRLPTVVFFAKDREGRYVLVNETLRERCGAQHKEDLLGRTAEEVFPAPLGAGYTAQDRQVIATGETIEDKLELHLHPGGGRGWCLTYKAALAGTRGERCGLLGLSRDLHRPDRRHREYRRLAAALGAIQEGFGGPLRLEELAREAGLSMDRFERLVKRVFHLTPRQLLTKTRIEAASHLLRDGSRTIAEVAQACGYRDHSAFTRQFRTTVGLTPREFREGR